MDAIKLVIADDHSMIREGLKQLLELEGQFKVIAEASDGVECLEILSKEAPDVLLLDINMPNKNGLDVLKELNQSGNRKVKVLVLTVHNEVEYLIKAVELGVDGYVLKDSESSELKKAIMTILNGETYIQPDLIPMLNAKMISMAIGMYNKEIATKLEISERTVKNHVSNIFKKIGVSDRTQAAVFAIRNNLIDIHN